MYIGFSRGNLPLTASIALLLSLSRNRISFATFLLCAFKCFYHRRSTDLGDTSHSRYILKMMNHPFPYYSRSIIQFDPHNQCMPQFSNHLETILDNSFIVITIVHTDSCTQNTWITFATSDWTMIEFIFTSLCERIFLCLPVNRLTRV